MKLKKTQFSTVKICFFRRCRYRKGISVCQDFCCWKKPHILSTLHITLPKTIGYVKGYVKGQTKSMLFLIEDENLLEKYDTSWGRVNSDI